MTANNGSVQNLYIVLTATGTKISRMIKIFTRAPFNHVSISDDEHLEYMFSFARQNAPHLFPSGFVKETATSGIFGMCEHIPCQVYEVGVTKEQYAKFRFMIETFSKAPEFYQFNILGFATMIFNIPLRRKRKYMCSQFVAYALSECGILSFDKDFSLVKPNDFRNIKNLRLVYSGDMKMFTAPLQKLAV